MKKSFLEKILSETKINGGGSYSINGQEPKKGYMVSIRDCEVLDLKDLNYISLSKVINKNNDLLKKNNIYLGTWIDVRSNKLFIDISKNYKNKKTALKVAGKNNQMAIWDIVNGCEIRLD